MANVAAFIPAPKAQLVVLVVDKPTPGPTELLVRNEAVALNPLEAKAARLDTLPLEYPTVLGSTFGGVVEAIGSDVLDFHVGEKVAVARKVGQTGNKYGAYQRYVLAPENMVCKVMYTADPAIYASIMMNMMCIAGLFIGRFKFTRPILYTTPPPQGKRLLIYGGSSGFGSLAVQFLVQAGYEIVTTCSPMRRQFVEQFGAAAVVDHQQEPDVVIQELVARGPFDLVVDCISLPQTIGITSRVVFAHGGGPLVTTQPAFGPESLPEGVTRIYEPWSGPLYEQANAGLLAWLIESYIPQAFRNRKIVPLPLEKLPGGLLSLNDGLDRLLAGVRGSRLIVNPWDE